MATKSDYYGAGSTELATETALTITRLEPRRKLTKTSSRLVIVLVGLPARGKSFVARKINSYMRWTGSPCEIFNVGRYRRQAYAAMQKANGKKNGDVTSGACDATFFDPNNQEAAALREKVAHLALEDMLKWLDNDDEEWDQGEDSDDQLLNQSDPDFSRHSAISISQQSTGGAKLEFDQHGKVAIFDATNSTKKRRQWILEQITSTLRGGRQTGVVFVESLCNDRELIEENYRFKVANSPDYKGMSTEEALADLRKRVEKYEAQYETIEDDSLSYIKVFNLSTKLLVNHIYGRMAKDLVPALMAWHIGTRPIYLCRPGQTLSGVHTDGEDYVARDKLDASKFSGMSSRVRRKSMRGDSLGPQGERFRERLLDCLHDEVHSFSMSRASVRDMASTGTSISGLAPGVNTVAFSDPGVDENNNSDNNDSDDNCNDNHNHNKLHSVGSREAGEPFPLQIITSTMPRAVDTVTWPEFDFPVNQMSNLNPLDKGDFAGMELDEIKRKDPRWYGKLERDPYGTRFPGGESYRDLIRRLSSVVIDVEQQVIPTLVVSHVSILQCLIAYFRGTPVETCMSIEVPLHTIVKFTPVRGGGWKESHVPLSDVGVRNGNDPSNKMKPVESMSEISQVSTSEGAMGGVQIWNPAQVTTY